MEIKKKSKCVSGPKDHNSLSVNLKRSKKEQNELDEIHKKVKRLGIETFDLIKISVERDLKLEQRKELEKSKKDEKKPRIDETIFSDFVRFVKNVTFSAEVGRI